MLACFDQEILWAYPDNVFYAEGSPFRGPNEVFNKVFCASQPNGKTSKSSRGVYRRRRSCRGAGSGDRYVLARPAATIDVDTAHVWTIREGRAIEFFAYTDTLAYSRAAGLVQ